MKKYILVFICLLRFLYSDEILFNDVFKRAHWRAVNTSEYASIDDQVLHLQDDRRYIPSLVRGSFHLGSRFRLEVEGKGSGKLNLILFSYGEKIEQLKSEDFSLTEDFTSFSFDCQIPAAAYQLALVIQGAGHYRKAVLTRLFDPDYELLPSPPYQMVSAEPEKIEFTLYKNAMKVNDANITIKGQEAYHSESGATAFAHIDREDTATFDQFAKQIKLEKAVNILYLGDSLTHFDLGHNHVDKTAFFLNKYNPGKVSAHNYACGGDDIQRVVKRLQGDTSGKWGKRYHDLWTREYDWAFVFLGHNDTKASSLKNFEEALIPPQLQEKLYEELISILEEKKIKRIILISASSSNFAICKANSDKSKGGHNRFGEPRHLEAFNSILKKLSEKHQLEYMDIYQTMKSLANKAELLNPKDGVHLTAAGHSFMAQQTLKYLAEK